jgi:hypothetical protein
MIHISQVVGQTLVTTKGSRYNFAPRYWRNQTVSLPSVNYSLSIRCHVFVARGPCLSKLSDWNLVVGI